MDKVITGSVQVEQERLYVIKSPRGYVGHPNWRITSKIGGAVTFADYCMAKDVADYVGGKVYYMALLGMVEEKEKKVETTGRRPIAKISLPPKKKLNRGQ